MLLVISILINYNNILKYFKIQSGLFYNFIYFAFTFWRPLIYEESYIHNHTKCLTLFFDLSIGLESSNEHITKNKSNISICSRADLFLIDSIGRIQPQLATKTVTLSYISDSGESGSICILAIVKFKLHMVPPQCSQYFMSRSILFAVISSLALS